MKTVYNYRNVSNILCNLDKAPVGFYYKDYPEINKLRHQASEPAPEDKKWVAYTFCPNQSYKVSIDFKERELVFKPTSKVINSSVFKIQGYPFSHFKYFHVFEKRIYRPASGSKYFYSISHDLSYTGEKVMANIGQVENLDFTVPIEHLTLLEIKTTFWSKKTKAKLKFTDALFSDISELILTFSREDKKDAEFLLNDINSVRRQIYSEQHEKVMNRLENL